MKYIVSLLVSFIICLSFVSPIFANAPDYLVSPTRVNIRVKKPETITLPFILTNRSSTPLDLSLGLNEFQDAKTKDGSIQYIQAQSSQYQSLFNSIGVMNGSGQDLKSISLQPFETKKVSIDIHINKNISKQDYYFSVIFYSENKETADPLTSYSTIQAGIAVPILLTNQLPISQAIHIQDIQSKAFYLNGPFQIRITAENSGDRYEVIQGSLGVFTVLGQQIESISLQNTSILSHSQRSLADTQMNTLISGNQRFLIGLYTVKINLTSETGTISKTLYFFALPLPFIIILICIALFLSGIYLKVRRKLRKSQ